jgi:hypothetical protein
MHSSLMLSDVMHPVDTTLYTTQSIPLCIPHSRYHSVYHTVDNTLYTTQSIPLCIPHSRYHSVYHTVDTTLYTTQSIPHSLLQATHSTTHREIGHSILPSVDPSLDVVLTLIRPSLYYRFSIHSSLHPVLPSIHASTYPIPQPGHTHTQLHDGVAKKLQGTRNNMRPLPVSRRTKMGSLSRDKREPSVLSKVRITFLARRLLPHCAFPAPHLITSSLLYITLHTGSLSIHKNIRHERCFVLSRHGGGH